ncbi:Biotin--[acetyl-CoA-carboxylase] synthetase [mine drainage metagenome]|uniref:Biotin--[acetyl-CoA-carboxylase] synthetase n=1 Tax=mine drainage metagenome TaxID=410659 RepID=T1BV84_9ZZZZ
MAEEIRQVYEEQLPSTQDLALAWAREGVGPGSYVAAGEQTAGRGQPGRQWHSPPGGLYVSAILPLGEAGLPWLSLVSGLALRDSLAPAGRFPLWIKWPNDLVVAATSRSPAPRKLAGILVDVLVGLPRGLRAVVGVGLNVRRPSSSPPPGLQERMAFLAEETGGSMEPRELLPTVLSALHRPGRTSWTPRPSPGSLAVSPPPSGGSARRSPARRDRGPSWAWMPPGLPGYGSSKGRPVRSSPGC